MPAREGALPPAKWRGTEKEPRGWSCSIQVAFPKGQHQAAHGGRRFQNVTLTACASQAEAAAAFDLLALWRQCAVLGKQAEAVQYNLGLARYSKHQRALLGCSTVEQALDFVRGLRDAGVLSSLVADVVQQLAPVPASSGGVEQATEAAAAAGGAQAAQGAQPTSTAGRAARAASRAGAASAGGGRKRKRGSGGAAAAQTDDEVEEEAEEEGVVEAAAAEEQEEEEEEAAEEGEVGTAAPAKRAKRARQPPGSGAGSGEGGGGGGGYAGVLQTGPASWAFQITVSLKSMQARFQAGGSGKQNLRVGGFCSAPEAAAAHDACMLWRCTAYGGKGEDRLVLNFGRQLYAGGAGAQLLRRLRALLDCKSVIEVVKEARGDGTFAKLAAAGGGAGGATGGRPGPAAAAAAAAGAKPQGKRERAPGAQQQQQRVQKQQRPRAAAPAAGGGAPRRRAQPAASAPPPLPEQRYGSEVVGSRVQVYWPLEKKWFPGTISRFDRAAGRHRIDYEDGDVQLLDLRVERLRFLSGPLAGADADAGTCADADTAAPAAAAGGARRRGAQQQRRQQQQGARAAAAPLAGPSAQQLLADLAAVLGDTPGLSERDAAAFLGRFLTLGELQAAAHEQLARHAAARRPDLVCAFVGAVLSG